MSTQEEKDNFWYEFGQAVGVKIASGIVLNKAVECFKNCQDKDAQMLKALAYGLAEDSKRMEHDARKKYNHFEGMTKEPL